MIHSHDEALNLLTIIFISNVVGTYPKNGVRTAWTSEGKEAVMKGLSKCFLQKTLPSKRQCDDLIKTNKALSKRSWTMVK